MCPANAYTILHVPQERAVLAHCYNLPDTELDHWVTVLMGHLGHLSRPGHWVTGSSF